jgi:hypothetical protein
VNPARAAIARGSGRNPGVFCGSTRDPALGLELALPSQRKAVSVAQRIIEMLIGRLITDEQFRREFLNDPEQTLLGLRDRGLELNRTEIAALVSTDPALWVRTAEAIDPRLQKASLTSELRIS